MTTAPRELAGDQRPYIHRSIQSLRESGCGERVTIFCEPGCAFSTACCGDVALVQRQDRLGCFRNWASGLRELADASPDWVVMLQDDVVWSRRGWETLMNGIIMSDYGVGALSPYTSAGIAPVGRRGWVPPRQKSFWGALALAFPRDAATAVLDHPIFVSHDKPARLDVVVGKALADLARPLLVHMPSLCDHIGDISTLGRHKIPGIQYGRRGYNFRQ